MLHVSSSEECARSVTKTERLNAGMCRIDLPIRVCNQSGNADYNGDTANQAEYGGDMTDSQAQEIMDIAIDRGDIRDVSLPSERVEEYRSQFQEAKAKRARRPLIPAPRFDSVYEAALARMSSDEVSGIPVGSVHISDEVKERLRNYRDVDISG